MSVYEKRYEVHVNYSSHYTDDPAEAVRLIDRAVEAGHPNVWVNEGYGDVGYQDEYVTEIRRRNLGPVLLSTLRFRAQRAEVQRMLGQL
jgi:hypothetical protein